MNDIEEEILDRKNRKKSTNMILCEKVIGQILEEITLSEYDLIICTGEGELGQTYSFFSSLASKDHARPIFFQNSLHNSTLGSVSLQIPNIHLGISASNGFISYETGIEMALASSSTKPVIIVGIDAYPKELLEVKERIYGNEIKLKSGACGALFLKDSTSELFKSHKGRVLTDICFNTHCEAPTSREVFPANGLEDILRKLSQNHTNFTVNRPGGDSIVYSFES